MKKDYVWMIVNDDDQPLYSNSTKRYWIFNTQKAAREFLKMGKHHRPRRIVKLYQFRYFERKK